MKLRLWHVIFHENGPCLLGTKKSEIMLNVGVKYFLSLPITFPVIVNVNPCQIQTDNTQISIFDFFQPNLVHYQYYKNAPVASHSSHIFHIAYSSHMSHISHSSHIEARNRGHTIPLSQCLGNSATLCILSQNLLSSQIGLRRTTLYHCQQLSHFTFFDT